MGNFICFWGTILSFQGIETWCKISSLLFQNLSKPLIESIKLTLSLVKALVASLTPLSVSGETLLFFRELV